MTMDFSYKKALLASVETWTLADGQLTTPKGTQLNLQAVTEARFSDMMAKRRWLSEFRLKSDETTVLITCNDKRNGEQRQRFFLLVLEVLKALHTHNPTLKIQQGLGRIANYAFACVGLIPIGGGLSILFDMLKSGEMSGFGIGMGLFLMLLGAFLIWCASPWEAAPMRSPSELSGWIISTTGLQLPITASTRETR